MLANLPSSTLSKRKKSSPPLVLPVTPSTFKLSILPIKFASATHLVSSFLPLTCPANCKCFVVSILLLKPGNPTLLLDFSQSVSPLKTSTPFPPKIYTFLMMIFMISTILSTQIVPTPIAKNSLGLHGICANLMLTKEVTLQKRGALMCFVLATKFSENVWMVVSCCILLHLSMMMIMIFIPVVVQVVVMMHRLVLHHLVVMIVI
mmetsp:Transcript_16887/g.25231  ORF Transcript_16887/g.25231 Transcript_16887/m.25231 type:complete len:205 (+) Transcript_16887:176-790(+)